MIAMISEAAVIKKPPGRLLPSRCFLSAAVTLRVMWRNARSFMSSVRGQVIPWGSQIKWVAMKHVRIDERRQQIVCRRDRMKVAMEVEIDLLRGSPTGELPPPAAPPFMPNTGPNDGSREERIARLPIFASPCTNPIEVTVLPSPETVGVVAVTSTSFPPR